VLESIVLNLSSEGMGNRHYLPILPYLEWPITLHDVDNRGQAALWPSAHNKGTRRASPPRTFIETLDINPVAASHTDSSWDSWGMWVNLRVMSLSSDAVFPAAVTHPNIDRKHSMYLLRCANLISSTADNTSRLFSELKNFSHSSKGEIELIFLSAASQLLTPSLSILWQIP
jgi:hypothetical protein